MFCLNISKTFDGVWHDHLLYKLTLLGICGRYYNSKHSFVNNRHQSRVLYSRILLPPFLYMIELKSPPWWEINKNFAKLKPLKQLFCCFSANFFHNSFWVKYWFSHTIYIILSLPHMRNYNLFNIYVIEVLLA